MDVLAFVASIVGSLAWPLAVVLLVILFRTQIRSWMARPPRHVKAGPFEIEWDQLVEAATVKVAESRARDATGVTPEARVLAAFGEVEGAFREAVADAGWQDADRRPLRTLLDQAQSDGLVSAETVEAIHGLIGLRNLAAHGGAALTEERVDDFRILADAVIYAIQSRTRERHGQSDPPAP